MINSMEVREDDETFKNAVDYMFDGLERRSPQHFAVRQYKKYKLASGDISVSYTHLLKANGVFDEFWLFAYESLSVGLVTDDWKGMKKANVSFLKPEYQ